MKTSCEKYSSKISNTISVFIDLKICLCGMFFHNIHSCNIFDLPTTKFKTKGTVSLDWHENMNSSCFPPTFEFSK